MRMNLKVEKDRATATFTGTIEEIGDLMDILAENTEVEVDGAVLDQEVRF